MTTAVILHHLVRNLHRDIQPTSRMGGVILSEGLATPLQAAIIRDFASVSSPVEVEVDSWLAIGDIVNM